MKTYRWLLALLLVVGIAGCVPVVPPGPAPVPVPPQPIPIPVPVPIPTPEPKPVPEPEVPPGLTEFEKIKVGDPASVILDANGNPTKLPGTPIVSQIGSLTIYTWKTNVPRAGGGSVHWAVHIEGGAVKKTFPW